MMERIIFSTLLMVAAGSLSLANTQYIKGEELLPLPNETLPAAPPFNPHSVKDHVEKQLEAISLYMLLMREDHDNAWAPFQLAISFAQNMRNELALRYLHLSSQRGLWYYYNLLENSAFDNLRDDKTYQQILSDTKNRYLQQAIGNEGKAFYAVPKGDRPTAGWPVIIFLHDYGKNARISEKKKNLYERLQVIYIELNATQMLSEESYRWSTLDEEETRKTIQAALSALSKDDKFDASQVYLIGKGQGSLHAANLLATYPQEYAGAMIIFPKGANTPVTQSQASGKRIFISYLAQDPGEVSNVDHYSSLFFTRHNNVEIKSYQTKEAMDENGKVFSYQSLLWLLGRAEKPWSS